MNIKTGIERARQGGRYTLENVGSFYSHYEGIVRTTKDPEQRGRLRASVPVLTDDKEKVLTHWFNPMSVCSFSSGCFVFPKVGEKVRITFVMGNPRFGYWTPMEGEGSFSRIYGNDGVPEDKVFLYNSQDSLKEQQERLFEELENIRGISTQLSGLLDSIIDAFSADPVAMPPGVPLFLSTAPGAPVAPNVPAVKAVIEPLKARITSLNSRLKSSEDNITSMKEQTNNLLG